MPDITTDERGNTLHERIIAENVVTRKHDVLYLHSEILKLAHQIVALRYFRDKSNAMSSNYFDNYTNTFDSIVAEMMQVMKRVRALHSELNGIEIDLLKQIVKNITKAEKLVSKTDTNKEKTDAEKN